MTTATATPAAAAAPAAPTYVAYDEVPYDSFPFMQSHPNRLATVGTLFGVRPMPVSRARILELGCAAGGNLIPIAEDHPGCQIIGVDLSQRQVADGQRVIDALGLKNIELRHASITDVDKSWGMFDYVICHGVFSWVPTAVQDKILEIAGTMMNPNGIAYISYNTYPGWHMRGMIRDMMRYHAERFNGPKVKTRQARALLDFLTQSVKQTESAYAVLLKQELETLRHQADHYLYHEHLEEVNEPMYFHQFAERAQAKGMQYLGEARVGTMVLANFGPDIEKTLRMLATDQIQVEQYMDFLRNRMFRETLICSNKIQLNWSIQPDTIKGFYVASPAQPVLQPGEVVDIVGSSNVSYKSPSGMSMATAQPLLKAAMSVLKDYWPMPIPMDKLRSSAREVLGGNVSTETMQQDMQLLALGLLNCYMGSDLIEFHSTPLNFVRTVSEKPIASPLARYQASVGAVVTNKRHEIVRLNDLDRHLVPLLNGENSREQIIEKLVQVTLTGGLNVQRDGQAIYDPVQIREALNAVYDQSLRGIARHALLIG